MGRYQKRYRKMDVSDYGTIPSPKQKPDCYVIYYGFRRSTQFKGCSTVREIGPRFESSLAQMLEQGGSARSKRTVYTLADATDKHSYREQHILMIKP